MVSPHQAIVIFGEPDQHHVHQRRAGEVDTALPSRVQEVLIALFSSISRQLAPVLTLDSKLHGVEHHLQRQLAILIREGSAEDRIVSDHVAPRLLQRIRIERAFQDDRRLRDIDARIRTLETFHQHARLQRRRRVDRGNPAWCLRGRHLLDEPIQSRLRELRQREVGWRDGTRLRRQTMLEQLLQLAAIQLSEARDRGFVVTVAAVMKAENQPAVEDSTDHVDEVGAAFRRIVLGAGIAVAETQRAVAQRLVELSQVVERQRRGEIRQLLAAQIFEHTVADAVVGHGSQLLFDGNEIGARRLAGDTQEHRIDRGEPAHGSRQIHLGKQILTSVPLEIEQQLGVLAQAVVRSGKRTQQHIVDTSVVRTMRTFQQIQRARFIELEANLTHAARGVQGFRMISRENCGLSKRWTPPVRQLCTEIRPVLRQPRGPILI